MEDIAPGLLEKIQKDFRARIAANPKVRALESSIRGGTAGYADAEKYAELIGEALSQAFGNFLTAEALPEGKLYYNIAKRILDPMLKEDHQIVSQAAAMVQQNLNKQMGIGLKAQTAPVNQDRIDGIVYKVSNAESIENVAWVLEEPVKNFSISTVTDTLERNMNFQGRAGLKPRIIRRTNGKCCKWCSNLAGVYDYPIDGREVYQRHEYCRCTVEYDPGAGKRQNVHTKGWTMQENGDKIEERKLLGLRVNGTTVKNVSDHALERLQERSVLTESLMDAIQKPLKVAPVKEDQEGRRSFTVIGEKATAVINPDTGVIITAYPTHKKLAKKLSEKK